MQKCYLIFIYFLSFIHMIEAQNEFAVRVYPPMNRAGIDFSPDANSVEQEVYSASLNANDLSRKPLIHLPVRIHLIHKEDRPLNVQLSTIRKQIEVLNQCFEGVNDPKKIDTRIRFCFSEKNIFESKVKGNMTIESLMNASLKMISVEETKKSINVFVFDFGSNMGGYAPCLDTTMGADCIFINAKYIYNIEGKSYGQGKSLTHLVGRYLGLLPIYGDGNCEDDGIHDTPIHHRPNFYCSEGIGKSACSPTLYQLSNNFMDALPDECANAFTPFQALKMYMTVSSIGNRKSLLTSKTSCNE
jgi:hypothetical protein